MTLQTLIKTTASALALAVATPALAQDDTSQSGDGATDNVQILSAWNYDTLYSEGWSVENMFDMTTVIGQNGEDIGDIENVVFADDGEVLGVIAQVGGFWDLGDTHVFVPWDEIDVGNGIDQVQVPVSEETIDDYDIFAGFMDEGTITEGQTDTTNRVNDDLSAGPGVFKATDLIGDFVYLADGVLYGYVADLIVQDGKISGVVSDARSYGTDGYYAYPYNDAAAPMYGPRYNMAYDSSQIGSMESFNYDDLRTRIQ